MRRSSPCWTSVVAGGQRPSRSPSATAATRWFRRLPVWLGRRFARDAGRLPATRRRPIASDALEAAGLASSRINPASRPRSKRWWTRSRAATRPRRWDLQESREAGGAADRAGVAGEFDHCGPAVAPPGLPAAIAAEAAGRRHASGPQRAVAGRDTSRGSLMLGAALSSDTSNARSTGRFHSRRSRLRPCRRRSPPSASGGPSWPPRSRCRARVHAANTSSSVAPASRSDAACNSTARAETRSLPAATSPWPPARRSASSAARDVSFCLLLTSLGNRTEPGRDCPERRASPRAPMPGSRRNPAFPSRRPLPPS